MEDLNVFRPTATAEDVGKALIVKTVADGVPTEFEYGEAGGGSDGSTKELMDLYIDFVPNYVLLYPVFRPSSKPD